ncbi:enolase-phosphatase E1-like [Melanotaenia boesemani]|uniref:enolase-phosphatase E1-like n=1 Tax=Melanotaenia boesemani TaxID=1250792 RepID=UPI001C054C86|nr:enolase-phosphatase E1-like [Melanotaenia boesemani]
MEEVLANESPSAQHCDHMESVDLICKAVAKIIKGEMAKLEDEFISALWQFCSGFEDKKRQTDEFTKEVEDDNKQEPQKFECNSKSKRDQKKTRKETRKKNPKTVFVTKCKKYSFHTESVQEWMKKIEATYGPQKIEVVSYKSKEDPNSGTIRVYLTTGTVMISGSDIANIIKWFEAQTNKAQTNEAQTDEAQTDEAQTDEAQTDEAQTNESQTNESQTNEAQSDEAQTDEAQTNEAQTNEAQTNEAQTDESQTNDAANQE